MRIKIFTHNDLDGVGCIIIAKRLLPQYEIEYELCNYSNINQKISDFLNTEPEDLYAYMFVTDISVDSETAEAIDKYTKTKEMEILLFDHHFEKNEWLNKYDWATIQKYYWKEKEEHLTCGTKMFLQYLISEQSMLLDEYTASLVEKIRRYDTWLWKTHYCDELAKDLNDLLYLIGFDEFVEIYSQTNRYSLFTKEHKELLEKNKEIISKYIESKYKELLEIEVDDYNVGVVFASKYISELGNTLCENRPELDLIAVISDVNKISYRTIKEDIDLNIFAQKYGGGGHPKASGSQISLDTRISIAKFLFEK